MYRALLLFLFKSFVEKLLTLIKGRNFYNVFMIYFLSKAIFQMVPRIYSWWIHRRLRIYTFCRMLRRLYFIVNDTALCLLSRFCSNLCRLYIALVLSILFYGILAAESKILFYTWIFFIIYLLNTRYFEEYFCTEADSITVLIKFVAFSYFLMKKSNY